MGYLDDLIIRPLGLILAVKMISTDVMQDCRARAGEVVPEKKKSSAVMRAVIVVIMWMIIIVAAVVFCNKMF